MRVQLNASALEDKENVENAVIDCDDSLNALLRDYESLIKNVWYRNKQIKSRSWSIVEALTNSPRRCLASSSVWNLIIP